ncbi:peptide-methionine (S)-S-oxide reductase MsrA [Candidatus Woesebacteria bacterium]|nr:peptide-methionine (S)-S-oxide reductase MsrA [Candidatus Woesebacteria bacterium]
MTNQETAILGGGCFWCTEAIYQRLNGVLSVQPGYAGGELKNPTYEDVSMGSTGHAEVIKVVFDPSKISYQQILEVFWNTHDPTTLNQQGADIGTQYRSIVLTTSTTQLETATKLKDRLNHELFKGKMTTAIEPATEFYPAEHYHQNYFNTHTDAPYCQVVISPKLEKFEHLFKELQVKA